MRFTSLQILRLNFLDCNALTNNAAAALGSALSSLTTLLSFSLTLNRIVLADSVIGCIAAALKSLHDLVSLKLEFATNMKSHPEQIQQLSESLATLGHLQFLNISFNTQKSLSDDLLEKFGEGLKKLVLLKNLILDFTNARVMTNKGVEALTNAIQGLHNLSFLGLRLGDNAEKMRKLLKASVQL